MEESWRIYNPMLLLFSCDLLLLQQKKGPLCFWLLLTSGEFARTGGETLRKGLGFALISKAISSSNGVQCLQPEQSRTLCRGRT